MESPTSGDPLQEWPKRIPVFCGASGLIWLDKANPEPKYLLPSGVKDEKSRRSLLSADHMEKYNFPPPLRSMQPFLIQGGDMSLSWSRSIGDPLFREVTLSRRLPWGTACTGALLVVPPFLRPGDSHHCSVAAVTQLGHRYSYWFCQEHMLLQL